MGGRGVGGGGEINGAVKYCGDVRFEKRKRRRRGMSKGRKSKRNRT